MGTRRGLLLAKVSQNKKNILTILSRIEKKKIRTKHYESFLRTRVFHARPNELSRAFLTMNFRWARSSPFSSSAPKFCSAMVAIVAMVDFFSILNFLFKNFEGRLRWVRWLRLMRWLRWLIFSVPSG